MKVTAFIRKTAAKNNITDQARVYFRVRDIGGVDIKAASELSINPNHWSPERQGYKPRVALVSEEKKMAFDRDVCSRLPTSSRKSTTVAWTATGSRG
ncbi:MAG: hypothetical protein ACLVJK_04545 [Alistipes putredinis]